MATAPLPPRQTANPAPPRPARSVRRTCSLDVEWPDGALGNRVVHGRARDLRTNAAGQEGEVLASAELHATLTLDKTIAAISASPSPARLGDLVGQTAGNHLRLFIREALPELIASGDPLYLALDDLSGTSLVSSWAWLQWKPDALERLTDLMPADQVAKFQNRAGVCWGLQEGHSGMQTVPGQHTIPATEAGDLRNPQDPEGWHLFPSLEGVSFRRARRIDVTLDKAAGLIRIDAAFQDSSPMPQGGRAAIHEYLLRATADAATLELLSVEPEARILPFHECPGAMANVHKLIGSSLPAIRDTVLANLRGTAGCTHLNDALRALAEVPRLAEALKG